MRIVKVIFTGTVFLAFQSLFSSSEFDYCRINDKDGYTNVRSGRGTEFEVIGQLKKDQIFACKIDENYDWYEVLEPHFCLNVQPKKYRAKLYIHKSRVQKIADLPSKEKRALLEKSFAIYRDLGNQRAALWNHSIYDNGWSSEEDSLIYKKLHYSSECEHESRYVLLLQDCFPNYICETQDQELLKLFFDTIYANNGSASESPPWALAECYVCDEELILSLIKSIKNRDKRRYVLGQLEFGILNLAPDIIEDFKRITADY